MRFFRLPLIIGTLPVTLTNGTTADATQVMSDLNWVVNQVNANAAPLSNTALLNANNNFTAVQSGLAAVAGANFPIASQVQNWSFNTLTSTLGTNAITARIAELTLSAYAVGQVFTFIPTNPNTGSVTLNIDALGSGVIKSNGQQLVGGELGSSTAMVRVASAGAMPVMDLLNNNEADGETYTTFTFNGSGGSTVSLTLTWQKIGKWVTLNIPQAQGTSGTSSTNLVANTALSVAARPATAQACPINNILNNGLGINSAGRVSIATSGVITILRDENSTAWTDASTCGTDGSTSVTFFVG